MRKFKLVLFSLLAVIVLAFPLAACSANGTLSKPAGLLFNIDTYTLSWFEVPNARRYEVDVVSADGESVFNNTTRRTNYDLSELTEGTYKVKVRAIGGDDMNVFSPWSEEKSFDRAIETGVIYTLIKNDTEYIVSGVGRDFQRGKLVIEDTHYGKPVTEIGVSAFNGSNKIEEVVLGKNIKVIGDNAFLGCSSLTTITFTDAVTSIGKSSFRNCSKLQSVKLSENIVTIPYLCFAYCPALESVKFGSKLVSVDESAFISSGIKQLEFPDAFRTMDKSAFANCTKLTKVIFDPAIQLIGESAFAGCTSLKETNFDTLKLNGTLTLDRYSFANTGLVSVHIPSGVDAIDSYSFNECRDLTEITIPETVTRIGVHAFLDSKLYKDQIENSPYGDGKALIYADKWLVGCTDELLLDPNFQNLVEKGYKPPLTEEQIKTTVFEFKEDVVGIAQRVFNRVTTKTIQKEETDLESGETVVKTEVETVYTKLKYVYFPQTLKYIGEDAFTYCKDLLQIQVLHPNSLEYIGTYAFSDCSNLYSIKFTEGLKVIDSCAFMYCSRLSNNEQRPQDLTPNSLERIGQQAFYGTGFWTQTIRKSELDNGVDPSTKLSEGFQDDAQKVLVYAGNWLVGYNYNVHVEGVNYSWQWDGNLKQGTRGIADYALFATQYTTINIPTDGSLKYIGTAAFAGSAISTISGTLPCTEIPAGLFIGCANLTSVTLHPNLTTIGNFAFSYSGLGLIDLMGKDMLTDIGTGAFEGCANLSSITFDPQCVITEIKPYMFASCNSLAVLQLPVGVTEIGEFAFALCNNLKDIDFNEFEQLETIGRYAFTQCGNLHNITFNDSLRTIGEGAFSLCATLENVDFNEGLEVIGEKAFFGNAAITTLNLPSVKQIGKYAFSYFIKLQNINITAPVDYIDTSAFYADDYATIYIGENVDTTKWNAQWNIGLRPVFYSCIFDEDNSLVSIKLSKDKVEYFYGIFNIFSPYKKGFIFKGWSETADGSSTIDIMDVFARIEDGTSTEATLYTVWEKEPEPEPEPNPEGPSGPSEEVDDISRG